MNRIVSCTPSTTEILMLLGLENKIVGVDELSDSIPGIAFMETIGPVDNIDVEKVKNLKPDIVIMSDSIPASELLISHMRGEDLNVLVLHSERFDDLLADIYTIGSECGKEKEASIIVEKMHKRIRQLAGQVSKSSDPLRAYFEWYPNPFVTSGNQSWVTDMLKKSGAVNIFTDVTSPTFLPDEEYIIDRDPEVIFICWIGMGDDTDDIDSETIEKRAGWADVTAIKKKQIHFLPDSLFAFPGPQLLEGLELLIHLVSRSRGFVR